MRASSNKSRSKSGGSLTRDAIVTAAIEELDSSDIGAFSIRNVAARLGVYPAAIYWHIPNRNLVLAEIVGRILESAIPARATDWRDFVRHLFRRYRSAIKAHPNASPLIGAHIIGNSAIPLEFVERLLAVLSKGGFAGDNLVHAYNSAPCSRRCCARFGEIASFECVILFETALHPFAAIEGHDVDSDRHHPFIPRTDPPADGYSRLNLWGP